MAVLFGCAKENLPQRPDATIAVGQAKSRFLTLDSIQQLAAELPECFGEGALTRSGYTKSVADLFPLNDILRSSATKSGETDDAEVTKNIYVVNYADDGGFAILAADTTATERALTAFCWGTRAQLFWDGNKRTSLTLANKILLQAGAGVLTIRDQSMEQFNEALVTYYNTADADPLKRFLYDHAIQGIDL